jgi:hypothetical protein
MCRPLVGTSYTLKALEHDAANQAAQMDALRSSDSSLALINGWIGQLFAGTDGKQ